MKLITTKNQLYDIFYNYNEKFNVDYNNVKTDIPELYADITYKSENFIKEYSEAERTYRVTNRSGKRFFNMPSGSRSVFGNSLDGTDVNVRLDWYDWEIEKATIFIPEKVFSLIKLTNVKSNRATNKTRVDIEKQSDILNCFIFGWYDVKDGEQK